MVSRASVGLFLFGGKVEHGTCTNKLNVSVYPDPGFSDDFLTLREKQFSIFL